MLTYTGEFLETRQAVYAYRPNVARLCIHCCHGTETTVISVCIVELQVTVKHTTMLSAAQKCLYGGFLSPEEQRTYGSLHAKRQDIFVPF